MRSFSLYCSPRRTRYIKPLAPATHSGQGRRGFSKLGIETEKVITHRHANGETLASLAREYGVSQGLIVTICERRKAILQ